MIRGRDDGAPFYTTAVEGGGSGLSGEVVPWSVFVRSGPVV